MGVFKPDGKGATHFKNGASLNHYANCHKWMIRHYGAANKCENEGCDGSSKNYQYALLKGCLYEKNRDNYIQLCVSCHKKYDWKEEYSERLRNQVVSDETRAKISSANIGKKISEEHKVKLSKMFSGEGNPMYGISIRGEDHSWWGKHHSDSSKEKLLVANGKVTKDQVNEIRCLVGEGIKQKDVAITFGISRASVCRIIKGKRYKQW